MSARSPSPTSSSAARAGRLSAISRAAWPVKRKLEPDRAWTARATSSNAENPGTIEVIWNERASPSRARASTESAVMSRPSKRMRPLCGARKPEIWLISVVLPAPLGPITACSSPGATSSVTPSVTASAPKFLRRSSMRKTASATARPPQPLGDTDEAAAREHRNDHQQRPDDDLPVLGEIGEPLLQQQKGERPDHRAVEPAHAAEDHHDQEIAGALPRHVGGADEVGGVGEQ